MFWKQVIHTMRSLCLLGLKVTIHQSGWSNFQEASGAPQLMGRGDVSNMLYSPVFPTAQKEARLAHTSRENMETSEKYSLQWAVRPTSSQHSNSGGVKAGKLTFKAAPPQLTCLSVPKRHKDPGTDLKPRLTHGCSRWSKGFTKTAGFYLKM